MDRASILCSLRTDSDTHKARNRTWLRLYLQTRLFKKRTHLRCTVNTKTKKEATSLKQQKADRRSQRTYRLVSSAFAELMGEKPYEEILVQDILDRADIGRTTSPTYVIEPFLPCFTKQGFVSERYLASWPQKWT